MIDFSGYTNAYIQQQMLTQVDDSIDKREGSMIQTAIGPVAWFLEGLFLMLDQIQKNAYASTAVGESLDYIVAERGLTRKAAVAAVRQGTFNREIPAGSAFRTIDGENSVIFTSGELISSGSTYVYQMTCTTAGTAGNSYTGNILPITAISGLTLATIGEIITEGTDEETDTALRARYFETFDAQAFGGNIAAYRQAILAIEGVGAVQVYPAYNGGGTVLCSILDSNYTPATETLVGAVQAVICPSEEGQVEPSANGYGMAPIGAACKITTATNLTLNMAMTVSFDASVVNGVATYQTAIEDAINGYIRSVCETWGNPLSGQQVSYPVNIYVARIITAILTAVPAVVNVTNITINGAAGDLALTETAQLQQIPSLGTVTING